ncbi:MAG: hypothetical protein ACI86M_001885 [Saprospiraceae bacterium]|jgi:hypothetical protein
MKRLIFFLFTIATTSNLVSQQAFASSDPKYKLHVEAGETALNKKQYNDCLLSYQEAFKIKQTSVLSTLRASACAFSANNKLALKHNIDKAFELNWDQAKSVFDNYTEFGYLKGSDFEKIINERWEKAAKESGINLELMAEFKEIQQTDQEQRGYMREIQDKYGWDSPQMDSLWKIQTAADEANLARIEEVIEKHGYPGRSLVGPSNMGTAFLVIQHSNQEAQEKYLPVLKQAADDGELRWSSVALLIDRVLLGQDKKQMYGSQIHSDDATGEYFFGPIENPFQIDSIRNTVGLGPLQEYADHWEFKWDPEKHVTRHSK